MLVWSRISPLSKREKLIDLFYGRNEEGTACKVKPHELTERDQGDKGDENSNQGEMDKNKEANDENDCRNIV